MKNNEISVGAHPKMYSVAVFTDYFQAESTSMIIINDNLIFHLTRPC